MVNAINAIQTDDVLIQQIASRIVPDQRDPWKIAVELEKFVGTTVEGSPNTFLCKGDFKDFVLELEVKCDPALNSGVQVRSHVYEKDDANPENRKRAGVVYGPQCEIARKATGTAGRFYDEGRRGRWLAEIRPRSQGMRSAISPRRSASSSEAYRGPPKVFSPLSRASMWAAARSMMSSAVS